MTAALELVPIACLPRHLGRKAPVDVCGVVHALSAQVGVGRGGGHLHIGRKGLLIITGLYQSD